MTQTPPPILEYNGIFDDFEAKLTGTQILSKGEYVWHGSFKAIGNYRSWVGQFELGKRVGKWVYYNNVKDITKTMYYNNDQLHGLFELVAVSKIIRVRYENGQMHGGYVKHNFKNSTSTSGHFNNGLKFGRWIKRHVMNDEILYDVNYIIDKGGSVLHGNYADQFYSGTYDVGVKIGLWERHDKREAVLYDGTGLANHTYNLEQISLIQKLGGVCHGLYIINPNQPNQYVAYYRLGRKIKAPFEISTLTITQDSQKILPKKYKVNYIDEYGVVVGLEFIDLH